MKVVVAIKFHLKLAILIFWTKFTQKGYFPSKMKKMNIITEFFIFELIKVSSLTLN